MGLGSVCESEKSAALKPEALASTELPTSAGDTSNAREERRENAEGAEDAEFGRNAFLGVLCVSHFRVAGLRLLTRGDAMTGICDEVQTTLRYARIEQHMPPLDQAAGHDDLEHQHAQDD